MFSVFYNDKGFFAAFVGLSGSCYMSCTVDMLSPLTPGNLPVVFLPDCNGLVPQNSFTTRSTSWGRRGVSVGLGRKTEGDGLRLPSL